MPLKLLFPVFLFAYFLLQSLVVSSKQTPVNTTIIGSVFCDSCSDRTFSNRSYFLQGAIVQVRCRFNANSKLVSAYETTDQYGVYKFDILPIHGFKCRQGQAKRSPCQAILHKSPSTFCNQTGLQIPTSHIAIRPTNANICILNLNALSYRPPKIDFDYCGAPSKQISGTALDFPLSFFWPLIPPFLLPWLHWPPLPFALPPLPFPFNTIPLPDPSSLSFSLPPWLLPFLNPSSLPFPFNLFPPSSPPPYPPT